MTGRGWSAAFLLAVLGLALLPGAAEGASVGVCATVEGTGLGCHGAAVPGTPPPMVCYDDRLSLLTATRVDLSLCAP